MNFGHSDHFLSNILCPSLSSLRTSWALKNEYKPCIPLISCGCASGSEYWSFQQETVMDLTQLVVGNDTVPFPHASPSAGWSLQTPQKAHHNEQPHWINVTHGWGRHEGRRQNGPLSLHVKPGASMGQCLYGSQDLETRSQRNERMCLGHWHEPVAEGSSHSSSWMLTLHFAKRMLLETRTAVATVTTHCTFTLQLYHVI